MNSVKIYDYLSRNRIVLWVSLSLLTVLLIVSALNLRFNEDISDFLPLGTSDREAMSVYQNISGANDIYILFSNPDDEDYTTDAVDCFAEAVHSCDPEGWCSGLTTQFDISSIQELAGFVYDNIPYFLKDADYRRMDSLLAKPGYMESQLIRDRQSLIFPSGGLIPSSIASDPLALFAPVISDLNNSDTQLGFEMYDGYIFTPDMSRAIAILSSPFGNSETELNTQLLGILRKAVSQMENEYPEVSAHIIGGPEIAVGNSQRIKADSIIAVALSSVLIIIFLVYSFNSLRNIMLILLSIGWGWLFAIGSISLFDDKVSIIVIGISSVILGIAINYPLHLVAHTSHSPQMKEVLSEISSPLIIGNITTVGAFLALTPLKSTALHDLGVFSSLLLVGTILFVLVYLPHLIKSHQSNGTNKIGLIDRMSGISLEKNRLFVAVTVAVSAVLAFFSFRTEFDPNIANINYMTDSQKADMRYFQDLLSAGQSDASQELYILSSGKTYDEAAMLNSLQSGLIDSLANVGMVTGYKDISRFIVPENEQRRRISLWNGFVDRHYTELTTSLAEAAAANGFSSVAFTRFNSLVERRDSFVIHDIGYFAPVTDLLFKRNLTQLGETGLCYVVNIIKVRKECADAVKSKFRNCFDVEGMNSAISRNLSDNFNYIGWACSFIVFFFLWFSFGRIELAIISFLPMALSWLWILGIMAVFGIRFNIVNIILATFIFGQGDDYTIFVTEGCQYEYAYRRPILTSYRKSIFQSALIMLIGIGTLITARHPAMRSLAEVTIIGMFSVVLMAYMIPPFLFNWLTMKNGKPRLYPITLKSLFCGIGNDKVQQVRGRYLYKGKDIVRTVDRNLRKCAGLIGIDLKGAASFTLVDNGYGEQAILLALMYPDVNITAIISDDNRRQIARISAEGFVNNIHFINN